MSSSGDIIIIINNVIYGRLWSAVTDQQGFCKRGVGKLINKKNKNSFHLVACAGC